MKIFRQVALTAVVTLGLFSTVVYTGCKDKCGSTTCQNGGTCENNVCVCPTGYSGTGCENSWTSEYIGTYTCSNEQCSTSVQGGTWQSAVTVSSNNSGYTVTISNFANTGISLDATVDSSNHISITPVSGSSGISASGTYSTPTNATNGEIYLAYTVTSGGGNGGPSGYSCHMKMIKE